MAFVKYKIFVDVVGVFVVLDIIVYTVVIAASSAVSTSVTVDDAVTVAFSVIVRITEVVSRPNCFRFSLVLVSIGCCAGGYLQYNCC